MLSLQPAHFHASPSLRPVHPEAFTGFDTHLGHVSCIYALTGANDRAASHGGWSFGKQPISSPLFPGSEQPDYPPTCRPCPYRLGTAARRSASDTSPGSRASAPVTDSTGSPTSALCPGDSPLVKQRYDQWIPATRCLVAGIH